MRRIRVADQALRLAAEPSRQPYVCRSCLAAARQYHSTPVRDADKNSFFKRIQEKIFGKKKSEKQKAREAKVQASKKADEGRKDEGRKKGGRKDGDRQDAESKEPRDTQLMPVKRSPIRGVQFHVARRINPQFNPEYTPSTTWDGLEKVGGIQWAKKRADRGEQYSGFLAPIQRQLNNSQWQQLIHHVAVEVLTLQAAGRSVLDACNASLNNVQTTAKAAISTSEDGTATVKYSSPEDQQAVLDGIPSAVEGDQTTTRDLTPLFATANSESALTKFNLTDPMVKLAILKRTMQLTGKRIPDFATNQAKSIFDIYNAFKQKEKPAKLHNEPRVQQLSSPDLPNVKVYSKRRTPVHKEKAIGRWKVIEDELTARNLPVLGSRWVDAKEGKHLHHK